MLQLLQQMWIAIRQVLRGKYKWLFILFVVWLYRVDFIAADGGGLAKALQVVTTFGMLCLVSQYSKKLMPAVMKHSNLPVRSCVWLYGFALLSTLWAYLPTFAGFLSFQNLVLIFTAFWMFTTLPTFEGRERVFILVALGMAVFEAVIYRINVLPTLFIHYLPAGSTAGLVLSYCMGEYLLRSKQTSRRRIDMLRGAMLVALFILVTSTSSGANASALFGCSVAMVFSGHIAVAGLLFLVATVILLNPELMEQLIYFIMPGKTQQDLETTTGRTYVWEAMNTLAAQRPWLGWGFGCIERAASDMYDLVSPDAHNNYFGFYGSLGYVGSVFAYIHLASTWLTAFKNRAKRGMLGVLCALSCALLNGYSFGFLSGKACSITVTFLMLVVLTYVYMLRPRVNG